MDNTSKHVGILGGGSIGVAFAIVFARHGINVSIFEPDSARQDAVRVELRQKISTLIEHGLIEGTAETTANRVNVTSELEDAVVGAALIQECVPENVDIKRQVFTEVGKLIDNTSDVVVASSSSAIGSSDSAEGTGIEARTIVAHPGNPPYLLPVIELVPNPKTSPSLLEKARQLYSDAGLSPVVLSREIEGFVFNRLQGAVLREAYALVRDGIMSVDDIDEVVRSGLGRRWAFMGPFETVDLNTRGGIESHAEKLGPAYERMGLERGQHDPWTPDLVQKVTTQRRDILPIEDWEKRVQWRDRNLISIAQLFDQ